MTNPQPKFEFKPIMYPPVEFLILRVCGGDGTVKNYSTRIYDNKYMKYYERSIDGMLARLQSIDDKLVEVARWTGTRDSEPPNG